MFYFNHIEMDNIQEKEEFLKTVAKVREIVLNPNLGEEEREELMARFLRTVVDSSTTATPFGAYVKTEGGRQLERYDKKELDIARLVDSFQLTLDFAMLCQQSHEATKDLEKDSKCTNHMIRVIWRYGHGRNPGEYDGSAPESG